MGSTADTPLMRQYLEIKSQHPDAILFFRLGDFYEMFFDDAVVASRALELTLTSRDKNADDPVPMCGVPHHAASGYLRRLLDLGHKVAICEQVEDPRLARGLVRRAVTRLITPGVVLDSEHLEAKRNNFLAAIAVRGQRYGVAALDLSTFEIQGSEAHGVAGLIDELARLAPREIVCDERDVDALEAVRRAIPGAWQAAREGVFGTPAADRALVAEKTSGDRAAAVPVDPTAASSAVRDRSSDLAVAAVAAALRYAGDTQPQVGVPRCRLSRRDPEQHLLLDEATLRNLEICESTQGGTRSGSLLSVVDRTRTAMGGRLLRSWITRPLRDVAGIRRRHDAVQLLAGLPDLRQRLCQQLEQVHDLERLTSRAVLELASPREVGRLGTSLRRLPEIAATLAEAASSQLAGELPELLRWPPDDLDDVAADIDRCLVADPPLALKDGVVRRGFDPRLDELIELCEGGRSKILAIERRERELTGIGSLKVRYNKVFGYFIEVTRANLGLVPDRYRRKQTVANAERYVTDELSEHEARVLSAQQRRATLEQELFEALRRRVAEHGARLAAAAARVALLDVLCGLAELSSDHDYVRPEIDGTSTIEIVDGRHPVVERFMGPGDFVANDVRIDEHERLLIITGPNMAGKSTVMRQVALITILAQAGSFVPCRACRIGVVDRIFTRIGASDNIARGDSTFMVEMRETATILAHATQRSLVLVDEIGRGTATYDGISIAWAVAEDLHDRIGARTLFATHYHELCALEEVKPRVRNLTIATREWKGQVVFLRKLIPGAASRSYGIEVARLAGLARPVLGRARQVLRALEEGAEVPGVPLAGRTRSTQLGLFAACPAGSTVSAAATALEQELRAIDIEHTTPLQAIGILAALVERSRAAGREN